MKTSTKWFLSILAILFLFVAGAFLLILIVSSQITPGSEIVTYGSGAKIAVVEIAGVINSSSDINRQLKEYREDGSIRGILLRIESPGGDVVASQEIYEAVRVTRDDWKPVVVSMGSIAASGGYYVACGSSRIVANRGTLTGSVGVIAEFLQVSDALAKLGIDVKVIKTGRLKDAGSSTKKMTPEDQRYFQNLMDNIHLQFVDVVVQERDLQREKVVELSDGRVFTGEEAVEHGLIDTIGTYEDAVMITAELAGIDGEPAIVKERRRRGWWDNLFGDAVETVADIRSRLLDRPMISYRFVGPM
jgi:protease-4